MRKFINLVLCMSLLIVTLHLSYSNTQEGPSDFSLTEQVTAELQLDNLNVVTTFELDNMGVSQLVLNSELNLEKYPIPLAVKLLQRLTNTPYMLTDYNAYVREFARPPNRCTS